jgi:transcriptional regulator with XRE-family HTH domain
VKGDVLKNQAKFLKAFGKNLKKIRLSQGFTQEDLANTAEISISQIQRIEYGEINTTIASSKAIADALEIEVAELFQFL